MTSAIQVFATEPGSFQLCWSGLPQREVTFETAGRSFDVDATPPAWFRRRAGLGVADGRGGPGALVVEGLEPDTDYDIVVSGSALPARRVATARTASRPPGRVLTRFATVNDCHIGEWRFGPVKKFRDPVPRPEGLNPYPVRALQAALDESTKWGAEMVVAKGDITHRSTRPEAETAAALLGSASVPVHAVLGNHDVLPRSDVGARLRSAGVHVTSEPRALDLPGARLVFGHSPVRGVHRGRIGAEQLDRLVELAGEAPGPVVIVMHHPPATSRRPRYYPPPIEWADSQALVGRLVEANPAALMLAGHTHRNRWYRVGQLAVAEVGSTKDYPGQWAGYTIYEGGIAQVVRRISVPEVIAWTEMTARALGGIWGRWSPGTRADRCWYYDWPVRRSGTEPVRPSTRART